MIDKYNPFKNLGMTPPPNGEVFADNSINPNLFADARNKANSVLTLDNNPDILKQRLREVVEAYPKDITFREIQQGTYPQIETEDRSSCGLETAELIDNTKNRALIYGDAHGLIFPFIQRAVEKGMLKVPVGTVVNIDEHADIDSYNDTTLSHTASWQRYGVEQGFWSGINSHNWQPDHSDATRPTQYSMWLRDSDNMENLNPDILSIDLDFFNNVHQDSDKFNEYIEKLKGLVSRAKCVFVFSSSGWTKFETLSPETMQKIVQEIQDTFTQEE